MTGASLWERIVAFAYIPAVLTAYVVWILRALKPLGGTWPVRLRAALAKREASVLLDSARVVVLVAWMGNTPDLDLVTEYLRRGIPWCEGYGFFQWVDVRVVPPGAELALVWIYRAALAFVIAGTFARSAALVAALAHVAMWSIAFSTAHGPVHNHAIFMVLVIFALAPEPFVPLRRYVAAWKSERSLAALATYPAYVRYAAMFTVATVYVQTGLEKGFYGGPQWMNGITLQGYMLRKGEISTSLTTLPLPLFGVLAAGVIFWETFYGAIFFWPRLRPFALLSAWMFHEWVRWGMGVWPFFFMEAAAFFVLPPYQIAVWLRARRAQNPGKKPSDGAAPAPPKDEPAPASRPAPAWRLALLVALLAAQWAPTGLRRSFYPFASNAMFSSALRPGQLLVGGARIVIDDGPPAREVRSELAVSIRRQRWNELVYAHFLSTFRGDARFAAARPLFCELLLQEVVRYAEPRTTKVSLWMDYFNAGQSEMRTKKLIECGASDRFDVAALSRSGIR